MRSNVVTPAIIVVFLVLWLGSGQLGRLSEQDSGEPPSLADRASDTDARQADDAARTRIRARLIRAQEYVRTVQATAQTEVNRSVVVRAQQAGRVVGLPVPEGGTVAAGDLLCRIAEDGRRARVEEARERVVQARLEFEGFERLKDRQYQSETGLATARANLAAARAALETARVALEQTEIRAPFDGVLETRAVELGDYLQPGGACGTVIDPDPMVVAGFVPEQRIARIRPGQVARARLVTGEVVEGTVRYVANVANPSTRSYRVELEVPNPDVRIRGGLTADLVLPVARQPLHRISAALLTLDDDGRLGVRIVDPGDVVRFLPVEVVDDAGAGVWIDGLPETARIITVGQELVVEGDRVEVDLETGAGLVDGPARPASGAAVARPAPVRAAQAGTASGVRADLN